MNANRQPDNFKHLTEWWLIEREKLGNFGALRHLEHLYPQYPELSEWVMGFLDFEQMWNEPDQELSPEEERAIDESVERIGRNVRDAIREKTDMETVTKVKTCGHCGNVQNEFGVCSLCSSVRKFAAVVKNRRPLPFGVYLLAITAIFLFVLFFGFCSRFD